MGIQPQNEVSRGVDSKNGKASDTYSREMKVRASNLKTKCFHIGFIKKKLKKGRLSDSKCNITGRSLEIVKAPYLCKVIHLYMSNNWPELNFEALKETLATVQLWTQIVGKIRLVKMPWLNHSWHVTLYVSPRGLTTGSIPFGNGIF